MKEMTLGTLIAVFEEMFGRGLFWLLVAVAAAVTLAFAAMVLRERRLVAGRLLRAEIFAPIGAILAVVFVWWITSSGLGDIGGPIDLLTVLAIAAVGGGGFTILVYVVQGLAGARRQRG
jgi:hypothetical protein